jgi:hypothetical protein
VSMVQWNVNRGPRNVIMSQWHVNSGPWNVNRGLWNVNMGPVMWLGERTMCL